MKVSEKVMEELRKYNWAVGRKYTYKRSEDSGKIYRIETDALDTTACLSNKSDVNPYGWEEVK